MIRPSTIQLQGAAGQTQEVFMQTERLSAYEAAPAAMRAVQQVEAYIQQCGLEESLIELVKMRASQINGCAYCLDMHSKDARRRGESEHRLYLLNAWHESPLYTERERAALGWTEAVTRVADTRAPDAAYDEVRRHFDDRELVDLTTLIGLINLWNRLAIGFRYQHPVETAR
jgi:AhpD family alkylhydroperoxidase